MGRARYPMAGPRDPAFRAASAPTGEGSRGGGAAVRSRNGPLPLPSGDPNPPTGEPWPMPKTVILATARTPIGKMGGGLSSVDATELGALAIRAALERAAVEPEQVEHVVMG